MSEILQNQWWIWAICTASVVIVAAFLRMAKKQKWSVRAQLAGIDHGKLFSVLLRRWLPVVAADRAEEGIIVTALSLLKAYVDGFEIGILSDNISRMQKKNGRKQ